MLNLDKIYRDKFQSNNEVKSLGWGSKYSQEKRFNVLLEIPGFNRSDSVLDVGCGYGDLSKYVDNYTGIDLRKSAIEIAAKKYEGVEFLHSDIFSIDKSYDWVFGSGIFCFTGGWKKYTESHIEKMYYLANKGAAFNFLSYKSSGKKMRGMKYAKVNEVVSMIYPICSKFSIRHDYLDNDFTIYLHK
jgi:SAM-dependent methyltransferase